MVKCEVCVVGAGPAGLALAHEFLGQNFRVCVLESGGFDHDAATQLLADSEVEENDDLYPNPRYAHERRIGGTSAQWDVIINGKYHMHATPLAPADFRSRTWLAHSGWPIDYGVLEPYYARAQQVCGAGRFDYRPDAWSSGDSRPMIFQNGRLATRMVAASPQDLFQQTLPQALGASRNVTLMTWSNATELESGPDAGTVTAVKVTCLNGNRFRIAARIVILAQGAFEVPRLLLASNATAKAGLGNAHDLVGRFLMDRQIVKAGTLFPALTDGLRRFGFYDMRNVLGSHIQAKLTLSERTLETERILNSLVSFSPRERFSLNQLAHRPYGRGTTFRSRAYRSVRTLAVTLRERRLPPDLFRHLGRITGGLDDLLYIKLLRSPRFRREFNFDSGGWFELPDRDRRFASLDVHQMCEQSPDYGNRITLGDARDATGMPTTRVRFRWNARDIDSVLRTQDILKEELARAGVGDLRLQRRGRYPLVAQMTAHHPSGTTRMAADAGQGVVDPECRVHGVGNLFVASSSVFPTSGCAPPTLTILALAIRVGDKVKHDLTRL